MDYFARKKEAKRKEEALAKYGFVVESPYADNAKGRAFLTLIRGILVFLSSFGLIGGLCASFGLGFDPVMIGLWLFVISVTIAFTYYNKVTFYVGYVAIFLAFLFVYVAAYIYVNSGFQAFLNEVYKAYGDFFVLPSTRETTEYVSDRSVTVPAAMLFTGAGFAILLNISISAYMDLFTTFLLTFLPLQLAFYIDIIPPLPYLVMLITVYITVIVLGRSGSFKLPYKYKKGQQYLHRYTKGADRYEYLSSGMGMLQLSVLGAIGAAVLMLLMSTMFSGRFSTKYVSNKVKDRTDEYVRMLAQGGFSSLFNRYDAKGGISFGKIGGISSVSPDYETDLRIRFVPTYTVESNNVNRVYLKAYTGIFYSDNRFTDIVPDGSGTFEYAKADRYIPVGAEYADTGENAFMKMFVLNVDADNTFDYRPYFSLYSSSSRNEKAMGISNDLSQMIAKDTQISKILGEDTKKISEWAEENTGEDEQGSFYELIYTPYSPGQKYEKNDTITKEYEAFVYENYLGIPEDLKEVIDRTAEDVGLFKDSLTGGSMGRLNYANALKQYFRDNFTYSMFPGASPYGRDAIEYFLTEQKRGYCVHFAASAALLLRSAGIPTRYVEGYVINPADIQQGRTESESMKEWVVTQDAGASDTVAVSQVEIPDANAHAWIEIYLDGYGWIPFEMTPPSDGEDISELRFADFLAGLFNPTRRAFGYDDSANTADAGVIAPPKRNILSKTLGSAEFLLVPLLFAVIFITAVILIIYAAGWAKRALHTRYLLKNGEYGEALLVMYRELVSAMKKEKLIAQSNPTVEQVSKAAAAKLGISFEQAAEAVKQAAFSQKGISYENYEAAYPVFAECKRIIKENKKRRKTVR